jgi:hypothetical protein
MIRMPRTVKVGPHVYRVLVKPPSVMRDNGVSLDGWCKSPLLEIWVVRGLKLSHKQEVLIHELIHAAGRSSFKDRMTEENFVTVLAPALLQILQDNPKVVAFLTQEQGTT